MGEKMKDDIDSIDRHGLSEYCLSEHVIYHMQYIFVPLGKKLQTLHSS